MDTIMRLAKLGARAFRRELIMLAIFAAIILIGAHFGLTGAAGVPLYAMAVLNADNARAASRNYRAIFFNELRLAANNWWRDLFTVVPSDNEEEIFNWMVGATAQGSGKEIA